MNTTNGKSSHGYLDLLHIFLSNFGISKGSLVGITGQTGE
jgi:hypothetical protein